jgi:hypothetical protein
MISIVFPYFCWPWAVTFRPPLLSSKQRQSVRRDDTVNWRRLSPKLGSTDGGKDHAAGQCHEYDFSFTDVIEDILRDLNHIYPNTNHGTDLTMYWSLRSNFKKNPFFDCHDAADRYSNWSHHGFPDTFPPRGFPEDGCIGAALFEDLQILHQVCLLMAVAIALQAMKYVAIYPLSCVAWQTGFYPV